MSALADAPPAARARGGAMRLVLLRHPDFMRSQSMPRFAQMLETAYRSRGHEVTVHAPRALLRRRVRRGTLAKWAGYVDQYVLFPIELRRLIARSPADALFVFCDQALGPWVPLVRHRPHVVHVHDLLALRSALGDIPENPTSRTGRLYQRYIRRGFRQARHFISVSNKTREDLHRFGRIAALSSDVVYHGLLYPYAPLERGEAVRRLSGAGWPAPAEGMLLHVGGGQWYKNLAGIIALYSVYARGTASALPLWCVGPPPNDVVLAALRGLPASARVVFTGGLDNPTLHAVYASARALLFPSLAEGFGWPLIEAQACGCPVLTTDEAPMSEVGGPAARYLPRLRGPDGLTEWAERGAQVLCELLSESEVERRARAQMGRRWAERFDQHRAVESYLAIYRRVLEWSMPVAAFAGRLGAGSSP